MNYIHGDSEQLEIKCPECNGSGSSETHRGEETCRNCEGAGYIPTEKGEKVLSLMKHNFKPLLRNAMSR